MVQASRFCQLTSMVLSLTRGYFGGYFCTNSMVSERNIAPCNAKALDSENNYILTVFPLQSQILIYLSQCCKNASHFPKILGCKLVKIESKSGLKFVSRQVQNRQLTLNCSFFVAQCSGCCLSCNEMLLLCPKCASDRTRSTSSS